MYLFWLLFLSVMGLCWGSFLNVLYFRTMSGQSLFYPPSTCPLCFKQLKWYHLIPVVSFIRLKGRCEFCDGKISLIYPVGEILGCVIFLFSFLHFHSVIDSISVIFILSMLLVLSLTDFKIRQVSRWLCLIVLFAGIVFNRSDIIASLSGALLMSCVILLIYYLGNKVFNQEIIGLGDVYLFAAFGAVVGINNISLYSVYIIFIACLLVLPYYIFVLIKNMNLKVLKYLTFFIVACFFLYVLKNITLPFGKPLLLVVLGGILYFAYRLIVFLLNDIKNAESHLYLPLTPAILLSCLIFLV